MLVELPCMLDNAKVDHFRYYYLLYKAPFKALLKEEEKVARAWNGRGYIHCRKEVGGPDWSATKMDKPKG